MRSATPAPIPAATFSRRRAEVFRRLGDGVMVLPAADIQFRSRDTERPYVPDRELYYLTGLTEPGSVAVLVGGDDAALVLFVRDRDPEAELWAGPRLGPEGARELVATEACHPLSDLRDVLPELLGRGDRIHFRLGRGGPAERTVLDALRSARARGARKGSGPRGVEDPGEILDELRLVKDEGELAWIRHACSLTVAGHRAGAGAIGAGVGEWAVEAAIEGTFRGAGGTGPAFDTIVGSGENACVLHYVQNADVLDDGALVLVDAGAEAGLYHGDVTRTYPVSGRFSGRQRDVYTLVDAARESAIESVEPGAAIGDVHAAAVRVLTQGLVDLGVLEGSVDDLMEEERHKAYFPHQTSHWLGLDVHDPGDYARDGGSRVLEAGMVLTVEPGLYFRGDLEGPASDLAGIGVRIEDDVVVTEEGREVLTEALPRAADEVEDLVGR